MNEKSVVLKKRTLAITAVIVLVIVALSVLALFLTQDVATTQSNVHEHHMMIVSEEQFLLEMIPHHQEAVDTSTLIRAQTKNEELKELTQNIINAQTSEIEMMNDWIDNWYPNSTYTATYTPMMPPLKDVRIAKADKAFLQGMIMHHEMAVMMAQHLLAVQARNETRVFAQTIIQVQTDEIAQMRQMLAK